MPPVRALSIGLFAIFCFAISDAAIKSALSVYDPHSLVLVRMVISVLLGILLLRWRQQSLVIHNKTYIIAGAVLFMLEYVGFITAMQYLPLTELMVIVLMAPPVVAGLSAFVLHERLTPRQILALGLALISAGVMVVWGQADAGAATAFPAATRWIGIALSCVCVMALAIRNVTVRLYGLQENAVATVVWLSGLCALMCLPFAGVVHNGITWHTDAIVMVLIGSSAAFVGFVAFLRALQALPASVLQPLQYTQLLWASLFGVVFFAEIPTLPVFIGAMGVVMAGLLFYAAAHHIRR
ncbi:MAG: DMT family transporter [Pseudomonadota bacterium]